LDGFDGIVAVGEIVAGLPVTPPEYGLGRGYLLLAVVAWLKDKGMKG
jgi:hypothetical protein